MGKQDRDQRIILVSKSVTSQITQAEISNSSLYIEEDVLEKALQLIRNKKDSNLYFLFFLHLEDMSRINNFFQGFDQTEIVYSSVVFSDNLTVPPQSPLFSGILDLRSSRVTAMEFQFLVDKAFSSMELSLDSAKQSERRMITMLDTYHDLDAMINIGKSLTLEKNTDKLLRSILYLSKKITGADAGSIFTTEEDEQGNKCLRFKYSHTFSRDLLYEEFTLPYDESSIAGYVAVNGKVLNIPDVYTLDEKDPVSFNRYYDQAHDYRTKSMLVVPMRNHIDQIIGVIQLINCKESGDKYSGNEAYEIMLKTPEDFEQNVVPFASRYENLLQAVASQAAIALENNRMIKQIENQFEQFVKASVSAIESQDPATSGHSFRVAAMCVNMTGLINNQKNGPFADLHFSDTQIEEMEFAALLHDFGKVYINSAVFTKGEKLYPQDYAYLKLRLNYLYRTLELIYTEKLLDLKEDARKNFREKEEKLSSLKNIMELVDRLNKPTVMEQNRDDLIKNILENGKDLRGIGLEGKKIPLLEKGEINNLKIERGTLNSEERGIIESHVEHTYNFVSKIPWPAEFYGIPDIARKHHEKLDGSGYPLGIKGKENLPIQSRIMTIADIFDALTAADRPYKKAMGLNRTFIILRDEAAQGKLDTDLVELFIKEKAYITKNSPPESFRRAESAS